MGQVESLPNPMALVRHELSGMEGQFKAALPSHMPVERFTRVVQTAIQNNADLLKADRRSLWNAAMRAAQDGLLPDGREGAIVVYGSTAQWMPMIAGLRKKVRNSGEIATWDAQVVYANDQFEYELGDSPFIRHKPTMEEPGGIVAAYSIATLKSGEKSREVMSISQVESVRKRSKASNGGPWKTDYAEMCRKTVARRHSKVLPMSTDLDDLLRRDDDLYEINSAQGGDAKSLPAAKPTTLHGKLDMLASGGGETIDAIPDEPTLADNSDSRAPVAPQGFDPERTLKDLTAAMEGAQTVDALNEAWDNIAAPVVDFAFPPDKAAWEKLYGAARIRIGRAAMDAVKKDGEP